MGIYLEMVDHDAEFEALTYEPKLVNDFNTAVTEENDAFKEFFYTHFTDSDAIEESARCTCGRTSGVFKRKTICEHCGTPVERTTDRPITPSMWIRAPEGVTALISPQAWIMLNAALSTKEFNFLEFLTSTAYRYDPDKIGSKETRRKFERLVDRQFPRGLNNFIEHFDEIIDFLFTANIIDTNKGELYQFIQQNKKFFFPKHLPIPSQLCFVVESTTSGVYIDKPLMMGIDAVRTILSIRSSAVELKSITVQNRVVKAMSSLATFHETYGRTRLARKPGLYRRHVFGSRLHFTARGVIISISDPHDADELHLPWGIAVQLLKYHIINKLRRKNYTFQEALSFVYSRVLQYDDELNEIFKEIIAEAPDKGLVCVFNRNPTLQRGSTQQFYITKIKTNVHDNTISMSALCLKAPNLIQWYI